MLPVETRFYTYYTFCNSVIENKSGVRYLAEECYDEVKKMISDKKEYENFIKIVTCSEFWSSLKFLTEKILFPVKELISLFEKDDYCLSNVYKACNDTYEYYKNLPDNELWSSSEISALFLENWNFSHTNNAGIAHILSPRNYGVEMQGEDFSDSLEQVKINIKK